MHKVNDDERLLRYLEDWQLSDRCEPPLTEMEVE
jgi:hypothetical protein